MEWCPDAPLENRRADSRVVTEYRLVGTYHDRTVPLASAPDTTETPDMLGHAARSRPCRGAINGCRDGLGGGSSKRAATRVGGAATESSACRRRR
jgi:hypothetical protein